MSTNGVKYLTAAEILAASDLKRVEVSIPEWGGNVIIRELTAEERDLWEAAVLVRQEAKTKEEKYRNLRALLVVRSLVNEAGERLFTDDQAEALGKKSGSSVQKIWNIAQRMNFVTNEDVEELVKNSEGAQAAGLPTSSPSGSGART